MDPRRGRRQSAVAPLRSRLPRFRGPLRSQAGLQVGAAHQSLREGRRVRRTADGAPRVAEYTELSPESAGALDADGLPLHREANIASHLVHIDTASLFATLELPWHLARKTVPHVSPLTGADLSHEMVCKYERFLFDAFPSGGPMALLRVDRAREFAPIKNASGTDSPESARSALESLHGEWRDRWLRGGECLDSDAVREGFIDPLESYDGEPPRSRAAVV